MTTRDKAGSGDGAAASTGATGLELSWFAALCDDDHRQLGVAAPDLVSSYAHCRDIVLAAQDQGFDNILLPSGYTLGIDAVAFAAAVAPEVTAMQLLVAVRCGELWPPQLARQLSTLDQMLRGRLTVNIISSDLPGAPLESEPRYRRSIEVMQILRTLLSGEPLEHHGEFYDITLDAPRISAEQRRCPPFYFGGLSDPARDAAAAAADVFLLWPDTLESTAETLADMRARAAANGRSLRFGFRSHVIVRDTESSARQAAADLIAAVDDATGDAIRRKSLDSGSVGVARQAEIRASADADGFVSDHLWTGVGKARSGAGAAIVGDPDQVAATIGRYADLGIDSFILSGYPHLDACRQVGDLVLPRLRRAGASP